MNIRRISISVLAIAALGVAACGNNTAPEPVDAVTPAAPASTTAAAPEETAVEQAPAETSEAPAADATTPAAEETTPAAGGDDASLGEMASLGLFNRALMIASQESGGQVFEVDAQDDGTYEVSVLLPDGTGSKLTVDPKAMSVLKTEVEDDDLPASMPSMGMELPVSGLISTYPGIIDNVELEEEGGKLYWKVELDGTADGDDKEYLIDVETLAVTPKG